MATLAQHEQALSKAARARDSGVRNAAKELLAKLPEGRPDQKKKRGFARFFSK